MTRRLLGGSVAGALLVLLLLSLTPIQAATGASSASSANNPVAAPNPLTLPACHPEETVSAPVTVYFTNASEPIGLLPIRVTTLQTKNGLEISNSSITVSPDTNVTISGTMVFEVTVRVPSEAKPGNYSGQLILIGANGGTATATISLGITYDFGQYVGAYFGDFAWITIGVLLSFVYSPIGDLSKKKTDPKKEDPSATTGKSGGPLKSFVSKRSKKIFSENPAHIAILVSSLVIGVAAFSYFLTATPGFGVSPYHDAAVSIIDGFTVHRLLDGTVPSAKS